MSKTITKEQAEKIIAVNKNGEYQFKNERQYEFCFSRNRNFAYCVENFFGQYTLIRTMWGRG